MTRTLPEDKVCAYCNAILRWYAWHNGGGYMHVRVNGKFYVTGHRPEPIEPENK